MQPLSGQPPPRLWAFKDYQYFIFVFFKILNYQNNGKNLTRSNGPGGGAGSCSLVHPPPSGPPPDRLGTLGVLDIWKTIIWNQDRELMHRIPTFITYRGMMRYTYVNLDGQQCHRGNKAISIPFTCKRFPIWYSSKLRTKWIKFLSYLEFQIQYHTCSSKFILKFTL